MNYTVIRRYMHMHISSHSIYSVRGFLPNFRNPQLVLLVIYKGFERQPCGWKENEHNTPTILRIIEPQVFHPHILTLSPTSR